jgi:hypothetical protein
MLSDIQNFIHIQTQKRKVSTKQHSLLTKKEMEMSCELHVLEILPLGKEPSVPTGKEVRVDTEAGMGTVEKISSTPPGNRTVIV